MITYREFINAVRGLKERLYESLLPRTLSFIDVLKTIKVEHKYEIADTHVDDFVMFRYELNGIFKKHHY